MGIEYAKILSFHKEDYKVIGRSNKSKINFYNKTGKSVEDNNLDYCLQHFSTPKKAIISVDTENTFQLAFKLIEYGVESILIEKPGSLYKEDLISLKKISSIKKAKVYIAYNRRFYESIIEARKIITKDKGIVSAFFDFTELSQKISKTKHSKEVKEKWLISNSSHIIDLVFYLCGSPKKLFSLSKGKLGWHNSSSCFVGSGITTKDILFSYAANWDSAGRWYIELMTKNHKLIFCPIEKLKVMKKNSFDIIEINTTKKDKIFKPGLYFLVKEFLDKKQSNLCSLDEQINNFEFFSKIANYKN